MNRVKTKKYIIKITYINEKVISYEAKSYLFDSEGIQFKISDKLKYYIPYNNVMSFRIEEVNE